MSGWNQSKTEWRSDEDVFVLPLYGGWFHSCYSYNIHHLQESALRTGAPYPQQVVQSGQGFDEQISPFVGKLITSSNEKEESLFQVEVQVTVRQDRSLQPTLVVLH